MGFCVLIWAAFAIRAICQQTLPSQRRQNTRQSQAVTLPQIGETPRNPHGRGKCGRQLPQKGALQRLVKTPNRQE